MKGDLCVKVCEGPKMKYMQTWRSRDTSILPFSTFLTAHKVENGMHTVQEDCEFQSSKRQLLYVV